MTEPSSGCSGARFVWAQPSSGRCAPERWPHSPSVCCRGPSTATRRRSIASRATRRLNRRTSSAKLRRAAARNGLDVTVVEAGLSDAPGTAELRELLNDLGYVPVGKPLLFHNQVFRRRQDGCPPSPGSMR
jgi:hypothetical protein